MTKIIVRIEAHYETDETPFARIYEWHPAYVTLECDCGEELTLTSASAPPTCRCGADHSAVIQDIQEREAKLRDEVTRPWHHDTQEQTEQHLRDVTAYPKGSPWRYNDITSGNTNGENDE
jgi:hypothetical protein